MNVCFFNVVFQLFRALGYDASRIGSPECHGSLWVERVPAQPEVALSRIGIGKVFDKVFTTNGKKNCQMCLLTFACM